MDSLIFSLTPIVLIVILIKVTAIVVEVGLLIVLFFLLDQLLSFFDLLLSSLPLSVLLSTLFITSGLASLFAFSPRLGISLIISFNCFVRKLIRESHRLKLLFVKILSYSTLFISLFGLDLFLQPAQVV